MSVDYNGTWDFVSSVNFEGYMVALGIDFATRKIASLLKTQKVIKQDGDCFTIKTLSTFKNYECSFKIGEEFIEKGMDNRTFQTVVNWENDKLVCLQRGEKKNRGWTHWIQGDELHLDFVNRRHFTQPHDVTLDLETSIKVHMFSLPGAYLRG